MDEFKTREASADEQIEWMQKAFFLKKNSMEAEINFLKSVNFKLAEENKDLREGDWRVKYINLRNECDRICALLQRATDEEMQ